MKNFPVTPVAAFGQGNTGSTHEAGGMRGTERIQPFINDAINAAEKNAGDRTQVPRSASAFQPAQRATQVCLYYSFILSE